MVRSTMTSPLVAREAEVAALVAALDGAAQGRPATVLVGGDAGVGKTRLVTYLCELATGRGATAVVAPCVDLGEVGLPYLPFAEALAQLRTDARTRAAVDAVVADRPALARLLPSHPVDRPGEDGTDRLQLFDGIAAVLDAAGTADAPLVLVVEDLHWADASSRDVLRYLVARLRGEHVLLVVTYRTDDLHRRHPLRPVLAELWRRPRVERLDLAPFTADELRRFGAAVTGAPLSESELQRVMERSEGNAYFAEELLEAGTGTSLPWSLGDTLRSRLEQVDPRVQHLARLASPSGRAVAEPLLRAVWDALGEGGDLDDVLREAVAAHVLLGEEGRVVFRHALLAEVVQADLLPGEQVALHRAYRDALAADPSLGSPAQLAHHARSAHDMPTALRASADAAAEAAALLAPAEELRHLETVLRLWDTVPDAPDLLGRDRVSVLAEAATAANRAGEDERAVALAQEAVRTAADAPARQAVLRTQLARHLLAVDRVRRAVEETEAALAVLTGPSTDHAWALATHARASLGADDDARAHVSATAAVAEATELGEPAVEADALATLAVLVVDDRSRTAELLAQARRRARDAGDLATELRCNYNLAANQFYAGLLDDAAVLVEEGLDRARHAGLTWSAFAVQLQVIAEVVRYTRGDLTPPAPDAEPAPPSAAALLESVQLYGAVARGDADAVERGRALEPEWSREGQVALVAGGCTIDALTWAGDLEAAADLAGRVIDHLGRAWDDWFLGGIWLAALGLAALADGIRRDRHHGGDVDDRVRRGTELLARAVETAARGRPRGGRLGPEGQAWLARAHAEHARLVGQDEVTAWQRATEAFGYGYRYEEARCRLRWAEALLETGDRTAAQEQLSTALDVAREIGARPLADALVALARRGRLDVPGTRTVVDLLTAREAEVLALVARGLSNRQIGEELFISGKTVSVHVSNLLAKLGASGRAEAVAVAHRRGLLTTG